MNRLLMCNNVRSVADIVLRYIRYSRGKYGR